MKARRFTHWDFHHVGRIEPECTSEGDFLELMPQARYADVATTRLHAYGAGPFCRFRIGRSRHEPGLYVLTIEDDPVYAGECVDLGQRGAQTVMAAFRLVTASAVASRQTAA